MIEIMKASAGSGKTFNLAKNYIHILLQRKTLRDAYRHILAITFTNKATDEMKSRILRELYVLSVRPDASDFRKFFVPGPDQMDNPAVCKDDKELQRLSASLLGDILHDYSSFCVSTIDKFFQRTLKSFAREIGHYASYQIELDRNSIIKESVDRVLDSISADSSDLVDWLTEGAEADLAEGKKYDIAGRLTAIAGRLKHFSHVRALEEFGIDETRAYSKDNVRRMEALCREYMRTFAREVKESASALVKAINSASLGKPDFNSFFYNALYSLTNFRAGTVFAPSATFVSCVNGEKDIFKKSDKGAKLKRILLDVPMGQCFTTMSGLLGSRAEAYNTARQIVSDIHELGVAAELYREFDALCKEKNILSLADSDSILKDIIAGSDAPFIYEKLGVRLENFLLDEFQDTSRIQWANIWPLLKDSQSHESYYLGEGTPYSLIVGDVKQSIYRWRGSEWNLLANDIREEFDAEGFPIKNSPLNDNYRSCEAVVTFNNSFFPYAASRLDDALCSPERLLSGIYSGTFQNCKSRGQCGSVDISFLDKEHLYDAVYESIEEMRGQGAGYGDIAILVRTNSVGAAVAAELIRRQIPVVTNDSLLVRNSPVIRKVIAYLSLLSNANDPVSRFIVPEHGPVFPEGCHSLVDECGFYLRLIESREPGTLARHSLYVQSFLDKVKDFTASEGNNLCGFLEAWTGDKSYISSPEGGQAVNVITVHKAKGLEFPYVIYLYPLPPSELGIYKDEKFWCRLRAANSPLEALDGEVFDVHLSSGSVNTLFKDDYAEEMRRLYVDVINVFYVAFTRPSKGLHIITVSGAKNNFSAFLHDFVTRNPQMFVPVVPDCAAAPFDSVPGTAPQGDYVERYRYGSLYDFTEDQKASAKSRIRPVPPATPLPAPFVSYGLSEQGCRLRLGSDSADFFGEDGSVGTGASARLKGTVLHGILSSVVTEKDLPEAVRSVELSGDISGEQAAEALELLSNAIESVSELGWFTDMSQKVGNELSLIDSDGEVYRPDRVMEKDGRITVIDYKFGEPQKKYRRQVEGYVSLYRQMGYKEVSAYLWYVGKEKDAVVRVA